MGAEVAIHPVNFFKKFDSQRSRIEYWYPTLKRYSDTKFKYILINKLQDETGLETLGQTNLGLAARSSRKRVKEALQHSGYSLAELTQYLLIWQCFQEVRNSIKLGVDKLKPEHFQEIAKLYSLQILSLEQKPKLSADESKIWLENIGKAIRQLLNPPLDSLDTYYAQLNGDVSLIDNIPAQIKVDEEMNQIVDELRNFLSHLLEELKETQEKQMLFLRYGLELKQAQVGKELRNQEQYQICRRLQQLNNYILTEIFTWANLEPSSEGLNEIEAVLCQYYSEKIDGFFARTIQFLGRQSREVLKLFYIVKLKPSEIGDKIHASEQEVKDLLQAIRQWLYSSITEQIQVEIQIQFQPQGVAEHKIHLLTENRLETILQLYLQ
ncbi:hypothetical protein [Iningainema tapete]|uniref:Uncharacterized protein n=1 Tax=Iningainema tapete BLCC-T55 TaxID=2748662 RepID=A0A8J7C856_9CYAN|nr:hypothetical protein [Iningainema tapete]MBD2776594.1 hypothetical protein [Iningainema tapete BLCC-T55]